VIGEPPSDAGAVHVTVTWALPAVPDTPVGAPGAPGGGGSGVTALDAADWAPVPTAFFAATLNVYEVPLASPVMTWEVAVVLNTRSGWAVAPM
jgi:hypothetical protein